MKFNKKIKKYIFISGISLFFLLYLLEGYLTLSSIKPFSKELLYEKQTGKKWDTRIRSQVYEDLKKINTRIQIAINPNFYLDKNYTIFPFSGFSNTKTIYCNENGYYSIYQSDRFGFNNPDEEWDKKEIEYLLIGDSFTHGACVNRPKDIASVLRGISNKSVLNLGYGGNGPLIEYATLREYLNTNVKKVVWIYLEGNDLNNLNYEIKNKILVKYLNDLTFIQNLKLKQNEINVIANNIIKKSFLRSNYQTKKDKKIKYKILKFIRFNNTKKIFFKTNLVEKENKLDDITFVKFKRILKLAKDAAMKNDSNLYFVYLPEYNRYKTKYNDTNYNLVKEIAKELKIPFIDIHKKIFLKEKNPLELFPFEQNGHYNEKSYRKIAETIYNSTKD